MIYVVHDAGHGKPPGSSVDVDAQAFITNASITNPTQQAAIDTLVKALKSANLWGKLSAAYPFVGGTAASHKFNLKNPADSDAAYRLTFNGTWTQGGSSNGDGGGIKGDGSTGYANTFLAPSVLDKNDVHLSLYARSAYSNIAIGAATGSNHDKLQLLGSTWYSCLSSDHGSGMGSASAGTGLYVISRLGATDVKQYLAGAQQFAGTTTSVAAPTNTIYLGAHNNNGSPGSHSATNIAFASIGAGLTAADVTAITNAVNAFQAALSR